MWFFDEIHKFHRWRNWIKGVFDKNKNQKKILVTGSAHLDAYSRGGDSLQGRYFTYRMHPFTLSEMCGLPISDNCMSHFPMSDGYGLREGLQQMFVKSGFPEPLFYLTERNAVRWRRLYGQRLVHEDIRTLEAFKDLNRVESLYSYLPQTVGSVLSINSLREDLQVSFDTVKNWIAVFERLFAVFRVAPLTSSILKAVKKEQKLYFWDWTQIEKEGARFENLVALHLLRYCHWLEDTQGDDVRLHYFRDSVGHEVDFIVVCKGKPLFCVEVKLTECSLDSNLKYLLERVHIPKAFQVHLKGDKDFETTVKTTPVRILPAWKFLSQLP